MNTTAKCPACNKLTSIGADNQYRPFCSERCKMIDLGSWLEEKYAIANSVQDETAQFQDDTPKH